MVTKEEARAYLSDVAPERGFWVNNGPVLKNLEGLASFLLEMGEESYTHHVNSDKNDFSAWVKDVIGDGKLANDLLSSRNKESTLKKLKSRVNSLKKKLG